MYRLKKLNRSFAKPSNLYAREVSGGSSTASTDGIVLPVPDHEPLTDNEDEANAESPNTSS